MTTIATALVLFRLENERCRVCGLVGALYSIGHPRTSAAGGRVDEDLRQRARLLVDTQEIPSIHARDNVDQILCSLLCGRPFVRDRAWYEIRFSSRSFWLDDTCFALWQDEMERAKAPRPYSASNG